MESLDNKTPQPVAPDRRPSLLSNELPSTPDKGLQNRMLASLERDSRMPGSATAQRERLPRRNRLIAVLGVALLAGTASLFALRPSSDASDRVASSSRAPGLPGLRADPSGLAIAVASGNGSEKGNGNGKADAAPAAASPTSPTSPDVAASSSALGSGLTPTSSAKIESAAVAPPAAAPKAAASLANLASASNATVNPLEKLASSDADRASSPAAPAPVPALRGKNSSASQLAARPRTAGVASTRTGAGHAGAIASISRKNRKGDDDADTELVAALIARLDRLGPKPAAPAPDRVTAEADAALGSMVRQCESTDLLEARRCRNRVCEKHWGKANACPASRAPRPLVGEGVDRGKPG